MGLKVAAQSLRHCPHLYKCCSEYAHLVRESEHREASAHNGNSSSPGPPSLYRKNRTPLAEALADPDEAFGGHAAALSLGMAPDDAFDKLR